MCKILRKIECEIEAQCTHRGHKIKERGKSTEKESHEREWEFN